MTMELHSFSLTHSAMALIPISSSSLASVITIREASLANPLSLASSSLPRTHYGCARRLSLSQRSGAAESGYLGQGFRVGLDDFYRPSSKICGKVSTFVDLTTYTVPEKSIHEFSVKDIDGNNVDLGKYKGKVLLVVNVASQCSLTVQNYRELVQLYRSYRDQGFEILAFPCNQFGKQEPAMCETIKSFAKTKFHVEFPLFNKVNVNGQNSVPLYKFLRIMKGDTFPGDQIKWNFAKFLVDKDGLPVARYVPTCSPLQIEDDIKELLSVLSTTQGRL
ncbi:hypothetical protein O6H91_Y508100 [Diphasiastrum complanatum]|nr:hypothetical protein O6H91_Y508100 [Diphasiastrum complanatum]